MNPLTLMQLLGGLGGGAMTLLGGRHEPSAADLDKQFGAGALASRTQQLFQLLASSPEFRTMLGNTNLTGQQTGQNINAGLARAGLLNTGVGATGSALGSAAGGFAQSNLIGNLFKNSLSSATDLNSMLASLWEKTRQQGATPWQQLGSSLLGATGRSLVRPAGGGGGGFNLGGSNISGSPVASDWGT